MGGTKTASLLGVALGATLLFGASASAGDTAEDALIPARQAAFRLSGTVFGGMKPAIDRGDDVKTLVPAARSLTAWARALSGLFPRAAVALEPRHFRQCGAIKPVLQKQRQLMRKQLTDWLPWQLRAISRALLRNGRLCGKTASPAMTAIMCRYRNTDSNKATWPREVLGGTHGSHAAR